LLASWFLSFVCFGILVKICFAIGFASMAIIESIVKVC
jgi:hypothetical protein